MASPTKDVANRPRILVVEREPQCDASNTALAAHFLIDRAAGREQALQAVRRTLPELIVVDAVLADGDGIDLIRDLRTNVSTAALPLLLTASDADEALRVAGFAAGADTIIAKSCSTRELTATIDSLLRTANRRTATIGLDLQKRAALLDSITDGFYALDRDWRFTYMNPVALKFSSRTRDQLFGRNIWDEFPQIVGSVFHREYHRAMREHVSVAFEAEVSQGKQWIDVHAYPMADGLAVNFRDITDRVRIEASLRNSEERYRAFVTNSSEAIWRYELDEPLDLRLPLDAQVDHVYRHARVAEANDALAHTYGRSRGEDLVGRPLAKMLSPDADVARAHLRELAAAGFSITNAESQQHTVAGRRLFFSSSLVPVIENGKLLRVWGTQRDITARKEIEQLLRENERRKDEFIAVLAHELRNPLAPVRNGLQILRLRTAADAMIQSTVAMMDRQMTHLVRLVDDLLDVSRITRGKLELRRQNVLLADIVSNAVEATSALVQSLDHRLTLDIPSEAIFVYGDPNRLAQIFSNLISNSAKYTDRGGKIVVTMSRVDSSAVVSVRDNGIGIDPTAIAGVFEMFAQVHPTAARTDGGLGIGLALVRMLVQMHDGKVEAHSLGLNQGSTFIVTLPIAAIGAAEQTNVGSAPATIVSGAAKRILVVDDNVDAAASLAMLLRMSGHEVRTANDGVEAIAATREFSPQIIFMDLGMPRMDGLEASRRIRELDGGTDITIVALTGWGQEADRRRTRDAGIDEHLVKPVSMEALERVLVGLSTA